jgi:peptidoglycan/LPS O-acetylase OafA/YrhL
LNSTVLEAGIALMLIAMHGDFGAGAVRTGTGPLRLLGRSSYEIYLTHSFVTVGMVPLFRTFGATRWIRLWYVAGVSVSVLLGWVVNRVYSEPLNGRQRRAAPGPSRRLEVA